MGLRAPNINDSMARLVSIKAQRQRTIYEERKKWAEGSTLDIRVPNDTTAKRGTLKVKGRFRVNYASGSPIADEGGFASRIFNRIDVSDGGDTFKNIDALIAAKIEQIVTGVRPSKCYSTSASAPTTTVPTTSCPESGPAFVYPATTQYVHFEEDIEINFEHLFAYGFGKQATLWCTKNKNNCRIKIGCGSLANLQRKESSPVAITYDNIDIDISFTMTELPHVDQDPAKPFLLFKEHILPLRIPVGASNAGIEIPKSVGKITGIGLLVRNSSANRLLSDTALKQFKLSGNGQRDFINADFRELQSSTHGAFGVSENRRASSKQSMTGFAFYNAIADGDLANYGIPVGELDNLTAYFDVNGPTDTDAEAGTDIEVLMLIQEIRQRSA